MISHRLSLCLLLSTLVACAAGDGANPGGNQTPDSKGDGPTATCGGCQQTLSDCFGDADDASDINTCIREFSVCWVDTAPNAIICADEAVCGECLDDCEKETDPDTRRACLLARSECIAFAVDEQALAAVCELAPSPIEREDVADLPAGDATGTAMSGNFAVTFLDNQCTCTGADSANFCETFGAGDADVFVLTQNEGAFELDLFGALRLTGGIFQDGAFVIGMASEDEDGLTLMRLKGKFEGPDTLRAAFDWRVTGTPDFDIDCSIRQELSGTRVE